MPDHLQKGRQTAPRSKDQAEPSYLWAWAPACLWALVIVTASSLQVAPDTYPDIPYGDKLFHAAEFFVYGALLRRGALLRNWDLGLATTLKLVGIVLLTAVVDEFHQHWIVTRSPEVFDFLADGLGGAFGILAMKRSQSLQCR